MKIKVKLNGTSVNPYHKMGFKQNPFPQLARAEYDGAMRRVDKLGADPIPNVEYIRTTLAGFSEEFIELCCEQFKPGEMVSFEVVFPERT